MSSYLMYECMYAPSLVMYAFLYLSSFLLVFHFSEWFLVWVGFETNMFGFLILAYDSGDGGVIESCYSYFFIQSLGSGLMLGFLFVGGFSFLLGLVLWLKMGIGPFYSWYVSVMRGLSWWSCYLLMGVQSILPVVLFWEFSSSLGGIVIVVSFLVGMMGSFGQFDVKQLIGYSSIQHVGWVLLAQCVDGILWMLYMGLYMVAMMGVVGVFNTFNVEYLDGVSKGSVLSVVWAVLSMSGVPPLLGFMLKWISFYYFVGVDLYVLGFSVVLSVVMMYVYLRLVYGSIMGLYGEGGWSVGGGRVGLGFYDYLNLSGGLVGMLVVYSLFS